LNLKWKKGLLHGTQSGFHAAVLTVMAAILTLHAHDVSLQI